MPRCFQIHPDDNVATLIDDADPGPVELLGATTGRPALLALERIAAGHKMTLQDIAAGQPVVKFGVRIGHATRPIPCGAWVHLHNLASDFDERSSTLDLHSGARTDTSSAYA